MNGVHSYLLVEGPQDVVFVGRLLNETRSPIGRKGGTIYRPSGDDSWINRFTSATVPSDKQGRAGVPFWQMFKPACPTQ
jgi:hypothetical protein